MKLDNEEHDLLLCEGEGVSSPIEVRINHEILYSFDRTAGILMMCAEPELVARIIKEAGILPCKEVKLPNPSGALSDSDYYFFNVKEIISVKNGAGGYFMLADKDDNTHLALSSDDDDDEGVGSYVTYLILAGVLVALVAVVYRVVR